MKVLLYSLNYTPELTGIGKYNGELAPALSDSGIETHVLTANPYYPEWKRHKGFSNWWTSQVYQNVKIYRCPLYVPAKVTTLKRLAHLFSFSASSALRLISLLRLKPDILILVQPTLFCAPFALLYCKFTGTKAVMHIQDFEVDAMFGLGMGKGGVVRNAVSVAESWLLQRFDIISSISYSMLDNALAKGVKRNRLLFFPNWADTKFVHPGISGVALREKWGFTPNQKLVLYSGNIGKKQGLEVLLDAAEYFKKNADIQFVVIGSGAYSEKLQQEAKERYLTNITFKPLQSWSLVPQVLAMADVHLVVQKKGAADVVLPSKLTNILAAGGHALVTAEAQTELGKINEKYPGIYELVEPENSQLFITALRRMLDRALDNHNSVAREYAVEYLSREKVLSRFEKDLNDLVVARPSRM